ncbi:MAG TPA: phosphotransferase [Acidimicrobiales bacterium]|nr:phosphotransferase [Acidimicrobiales bacterium]
MTELPFSSAAEVGAEALDAVLRRAGLLGAGRVDRVTATPIGTGQMAQSVRLAIGYEGPADGPPSVVGKFPSTDERSRAVGRSLRAYEIEVGFYRELAATVGVRAPACYFAGFDPDTHAFALVLEDLAPARAGDQLEGCGADLAAAVLTQAVRYHAPRWGDPALDAVAWLNRSSPGAAAGMAGLVRSLLPGFVERFGPVLDPATVEGLERGVDHAERWWQGPGGPRTLVHGDLRLDNLLIDVPGPGVAVVDWQTLGLGNGVADVSYFVGGNLLPDERRRVEADLVRGYHRELVAAGVALSWDECWRRYRHGSWYGAYLAVVASMLVERTPRGDRMFATDVDRHVRHAVDLDAIDVIGEP